MKNKKKFKKFRIKLFELLICYSIPLIFLQLVILNSSYCLDIFLNKDEIDEISTLLMLLSLAGWLTLPKLVVSIPKTKKEWLVLIIRFIFSQFIIFELIIKILWEKAILCWIKIKDFITYWQNLPDE